MPRVFFIAGCVLLACANWPVVVLINRVHPFILGLPPFVFFMFLFNVLVAALLAAAYRKLG